MEAVAGTDKDIADQATWARSQGEQGDRAGGRMRVAADSWLCVCGVWDKTRRRAERKPQSSPGARSVRWNYLLQQHCSATATTHHGLLIIMHRHIAAEYIFSFEHMTVNIHLCTECPKKNVV